MNKWNRLREAGRRELAALHEAFRAPSQAQEKLLFDILARQAGSRIGTAHEFGAIETVDAFRCNVPIRDYEAYRPFIQRVIEAEPAVLTTDEPVCFEQTGGSGGGRKLIPCTNAGLDAFRRAILAWIADLLDRDPAIAEGHAYFAISPATRSPRRAEGRLPVGLQSDAVYFGEELSGDVAALMTGATSLSGIIDFGEWQTATLAWLAATSDLTLISIWSPTFLSTLFDALERDPEPVLRALRDGGHGLPAMPDRAAILAASLASGRVDTEHLWPRLRLISAWADAGSARFAADLHRRFAHAAFQPKGLLATEGVFTLPLHEAEFPLPALTSTFLEFMDEDGALHLVDALEGGAGYQIVATTPGGLYRYRIGDRVCCEGHFEAGGSPVPMLTFAGRVTGTCDLVGEKLEEGFVAQCLAECHAHFAALVPSATPDPHYVLLTDAGNAGELAQAADRALMRNPGYEDARRIAQLGPVRAVRLDRPVEIYHEWRMARGDRLGDVKMPVMFNDIGEIHEIWPQSRHRQVT
ncbi:MAG: GH3 auxin-responsive promoter family protein [Salaquimonas sp.]|nr:GH3 auxin-responsive promoter family protein [Salaquimonas sp.]